MMTRRAIVFVLIFFVTTVTSDLVLVTSLEDNSFPMFEVYNPRTDQVDVVFYSSNIQICLLNEGEECFKSSW